MKKVVSKRSKEDTRELLLAASRSLLASDWPDRLSVAKVANAAGVCRGTAYLHFPTRADLIKETVNSVGHLLSTMIFEKKALSIGDQLYGRSKYLVHEVVSGLVNFAVKNPEICRIWLFEVLSSNDPSDDLFFKQFMQSTREFAESKSAQKGIDVEALSVLMLAGYFLWPVWVRSKARNEKQCQGMADRMSSEVVRLLLYGAFDRDYVSDLENVTLP